MEKPSALRRALYTKNWYQTKEEQNHRSIIVIEEDEE